MTPNSDLPRGESLQVSLTVNDLQASLHWYVDVVGFQADRRIERDGKLRGVALSAGAARIIINQDDGAKGKDRPKGVGFSLQISTTQDVDALARAIKKRGGTLVTEPADMPWGARIFRLQDPDGVAWVISKVLAA
jgi:lactoylglutathione lyase